MIAVSWLNSLTFYRDDIVPLLLSKVEKNIDTDCWEWLEDIKARYPAVWTHGGMVNAHRLAFVMFNRKLAPGEVVRHICDNRRCINPLHLLAGSQADNVKDMVKRGRLVSKLAPEQVKEIRQQRARKEPALALATRFGVSASTIYNIEHRKSWKHL